MTNTDDVIDAEIAPDEPDVVSILAALVAKQPDGAPCDFDESGVGPCQHGYTLDRIVDGEAMCPVRAAQLYVAKHRQFDVGNYGMVGVRGMKVAVGLPATEYTPVAAMVHAAWLVTVAEAIHGGGEPLFDEILKAVQNT